MYLRYVNGMAFSGWRARGLLGPADQGLPDFVRQDLGGHGGLGGD
jgi:hypothetical protein